MQYAFISKNTETRLLLLFGGWAMDPGVFSALRRPGYDIAVVYDYSSLHIDWAFTTPYTEIVVLAWSMGVFAADHTAHAIAPKVTKAVAVNGTPEPIHKKFGIPPEIFQGTLEGLNDTSLRKFMRRMCADQEDFQLLKANYPSRVLDDVKAELAAIADHTLFSSQDKALQWDLAIIGRQDRIFPWQNQRQAWQTRGSMTRIIDKGHFFNFQPLVLGEFIDKTTASERFGQNMATYSSEASVQADAIDRLMELMHQNGLKSALSASKNAILEIGSGSGMLTRRIAALIGDTKFHIWDLAASLPHDLPPAKKYIFKNCDAELEVARIAPASFDHIVTASTVQWFNSPAQFLKNCHRILRQNGFLAITTYVKGNLHEISDITRQTIPLLTPEQWTELAGPYFNVIATHAYSRDLDFATALDALRHLKLTGVNSLGRTPGGHISAREVINRLPMRLDGRFHLTYKPFIIILQRK